MVHSEIEQPDGAPPIDVDWRVRETAGSDKIIDVAVEGVSMSVTQRSDFDSIVQQSGIDGLLQNMQSRIANGGQGQSSGNSQ
jgi:phospholipid transport system substrate-binding protein